MQVIVAIDDTDAKAGPLSFIRGSGCKGHLGGEAGLDPLTVDALLAACGGDHKTVVTPLLKRGSAVCLNPYVIHGSESNNSDSWRRTFVNGFAYPGKSHLRKIAVRMMVTVTICSYRIHIALYQRALHQTAYEFCRRYAGMPLSL